MTRVPLSPQSSSFASSRQRRNGFSLIEVVLAIGVLSLAVVAMLGLFAPTMGSVKEVLDGNKANSLVGLINSKISDQKEVSYAQIGTALSNATGAIYFYAWERKDGDDPAEIMISDFGAGTVSNATKLPSTGSPGGGGSPYTDRDSGKLAGPAFCVVLQQLQLGNNDYDYSKSDEEAYIPFMVTIYQLDLDTPFDPKRLNESNRILTYPSARLR